MNGENYQNERMKATALTRYNSKSKTSTKKKELKVVNLKTQTHAELPRRERLKTAEKTLHQSKCSDGSFLNSFEECNYEGKLKLEGQG